MYGSPGAQEQGVCAGQRDPEQALGGSGALGELPPLPEEPLLRPQHQIPLPWIICVPVHASIIIIGHGVFEAVSLMGLGGARDMHPKAVSLDVVLARNFKARVRRDGRIARSVVGQQMVCVEVQADVAQLQRPVSGQRGRREIREHVFEHTQLVEAQVPDGHPCEASESVSRAYSSEQL